MYFTPIIESYGRGELTRIETADEMRGQVLTLFECGKIKLAYATDCIKHICEWERKEISLGKLKQYLGEGLTVRLILPFALADDLVYFCRQNGIGVTAEHSDYSTVVVHNITETQLYQIEHLLNM